MQMGQFDPMAKIWHHPEWLARYRQGQPVSPVCVEMDLTNRCSYDCPNCVWGRYIRGNRAHVCKDQILVQVRRCAQAGVRAIIFAGGGEPLQNASAGEAIAEARRLGLQVGLFTNGLLLSGAVARVATACCTWIRVHLDAVSPEMYQRRHGLPAACLARVTDNLVGLTAQGTATEVGLGSVVNPENVSELEGLAWTARATGCRFFQAKHDFELLADPGYNAWWSDVVVPRLRALEHAHAPYGLSIQFSDTDYSRAPKASRCHIHHLTTAINAESDWAYCKRLRDRPEWAAGNLKVHSIREVVAGERNRALSEQVTPHSCGIACPYLELNELLDRVVREGAELPRQSQGGPCKHADFF
jgi:molybdenum cofactor biosynthesis enzyme MoaA